MTDKLIEQLRDEDSYYRVQEKHWCIDAEELERQRQAAADRIEAQAAEIEKAMIEGAAKEREAVTKFLRGDSNSDYCDPQHDIGLNLSYAIEDGRHLKGKADG